MAEVVRFLGGEEKGNYMPSDELVDKRQRGEVYKAAGERLMWHYETEGEIPAPGDLLVSLRMGTQVLFSYGECVTLEAVNR